MANVGSQIVLSILELVGGIISGFGVFFLLFQDDLTFVQQNDWLPKSTWLIGIVFSIFMISLEQMVQGGKEGKVSLIIKIILWFVMVVVGVFLAGAIFYNEIM